MPRPAAFALLATVTSIAAACGHQSKVLSPYASPYGVRRTDQGFAIVRDELHRGVDLGRLSPGEPVRAAAPGVVVRVEESRLSGVRVDVRHASGHVTGYVHLAWSAVARGDVVARGEVLGEIGLFPASAQVIHLHLELHCARARGDCPDDGPLAGTLDPMRFMVGCHDPARTYPDEPLALTMPIDC